jgi:hypothetical protein
MTFYIKNLAGLNYKYFLKNGIKKNKIGPDIRLLQRRT